MFKKKEVQGHDQDMHEIFIYFKHNCKIIIINYNKNTYVTCFYINMFFYV